jgi:hypothetical protein
MLVYNTNNTIGEGFYYWDGSSWVKFIVNSSNSDAWLTTGNSGTSPSSNFVGTIDNTSLVFRTNNTEKMIITSEGNVGIGTTNPGSGVAMTGGLTINGTNDTQLQIKKNDISGFALNVGEVVNGDVQFYDRVGGTWNRAITLRGGNVGIGTTNPGSGVAMTGGLTINGTNVTQLQIKKNNISGFALNVGEVVNGDVQFYDRVGGTWSRSITLRGGNVGIGTQNPGGLLELSLDQGRKPGTNTWTVVSDERLKDIHGPYSKGLNEILKLNPVTYNYKNVGERTFAPEVLKTTAVGFSAQEVQKVFPEAVGVDDDGYLNFNMHAILVAYVNAIKDQQAIIEAQKMEIELLKQKSAELDNLKAEVDLIKAQLINSNLQGLKR